MREVARRLRQKHRAGLPSNLTTTKKRQRSADLVGVVVGLVLFCALTVLMKETAMLLSSSSSSPSLGALLLIQGEIPTSYYSSYLGNNDDGDDNEKKKRRRRRKKKKRRLQSLLNVTGVVDHTPPAPKNVTETGIDVTDPRLYESVDVRGESTTATVISSATGYGIDVYHRFVGSLRKSGYKGNILLAVEADIDPEIKRYFRYRNVTFKPIELIDAIQCVDQPDEYLIPSITKEPCVKEHPDLKVRWARYAVLRDMLAECETCTGPVLHTDVRDVFFQLDPFGPGSPVVDGLHVYQEHYNHTLQDSFTAGSLRKCTQASFENPMLCSGSTVGTRRAMLKYMEIMMAEFRVWIKRPHCIFSDQPVHNYLYYSGQLPFASAVLNRGARSIVNTAYNFGTRHIVDEHLDRWDPVKRRSQMAQKHKYKGATGRRWVGEEYGLVDDHGFFVDFDGNRSRAVHKFDRFGQCWDGRMSDFCSRWMTKQKWLLDYVPDSFK